MTTKMKLYVFDNGETEPDNKLELIEAPRNVKEEVVVEIYKANSRASGRLLLVSAKYEIKLAGWMVPLHEFFGRLGPHNATAFEALSKPARRYLSKAWEAAETAAAEAAAKGPVTNGQPVSSAPLVPGDDNTDPAIVAATAALEAHAQVCVNRGAVDALDFVYCPECDELLKAHDAAVTAAKARGLKVDEDHGCQSDEMMAVKQPEIIDDF